MKIFDINKDGEIEFGEFVKISSILFHGTTDEKLKGISIVIINIIIFILNHKVIVVIINIIFINKTMNKFSMF